MLILQDVRKSYSGFEALRGVTLEVRAGEVFALLGPNGAGKSTTIGLSIGLLVPDSGTVEIEGVGSPRDRAVRAQIGVATQDIALYEDLSARENLRFFSRMYGLDAAKTRERSEFLLKRVGLEGRADDPVRVYSGGMKRRLNLAVALIHDPSLVLLDEPTAGVDPHSRNSILGLVQELAEQGKTVVYSTHYMEEAQRVCDRVAILDHGAVLALGSVDELIASHGGETRVRHELAEETRSLQTADPLGVLSTMLKQPGTIGIHVDRPDLEAVFLNLTGRSLRDS